jgi:hypothetical protein
MTTTDLIVTHSGTVTRTSNLISQIAFTGGRTLTVNRNASHYITSVSDGTRAWTYTRDGSNYVTSWAVTP